MSIFSMQSVEARALRDRRLERIQIDHQEIDRRDAMRRHRRGMRLVVADREQAAMHLGVQCLDPAVHHFREAGELGDVDDLQPGIGQRLSRCRRSRRSRCRDLQARARIRPVRPCPTPREARAPTRRRFPVMNRSVSDVALQRKLGLFDLGLIQRRRLGRLTLRRGLRRVNAGEMSSARAAPGAHGRGSRSAPCAADRRSPARKTLSSSSTRSSCASKVHTSRFGSISITPWPSVSRLALIDGCRWKRTANSSAVPAREAAPRRARKHPRRRGDCRRPTASARADG